MPHEIQGRESFTPEQDAELERRAEERDLSRTRQSRFSVGEQAELDETAANLEFNEIQQRELTRRFRKRLLPFIAYAILVIALVVSFEAVKTRENQNRAAIVRICQQIQGPCNTLFK